MSKERLEEIKQYYSRMESLDEYTQRDIKWLIEQAERVQELEKFKRDVEQMYRYIHLNSKKSVREKEALQEQNKRYREELDVIGEVINSVDNADEINDRILKSMEVDE